MCVCGGGGGDRHPVEIHCNTSTLTEDRNVPKMATLYRHVAPLAQSEYLYATTVNWTICTNCQGWRQTSRCIDLTKLEEGIWKQMDDLIVCLLTAGIMALSGSPFVDHFTD